MGDVGAADTSSWLARKLPRRNFLIRSGAAIGGLMAGAVLKGTDAELAFAGDAYCPYCASCSAIGGPSSIRCWRYVVTCQDVLVRHCPGSEPIGYLGTYYRGNPFIRSSYPPETNGYVFGRSNDPNLTSRPRGWVVKSCLSYQSVYGPC